MEETPEPSIASQAGVELDRRRQTQKIVLSSLYLIALVAVPGVYFGFGMTPALLVAIALNIAIRLVKHA
jgi:hypothetical protein